MIGAQRYGSGRCRSVHPLGRNPGDVWAIPTRPYLGPHFAAFPIAVPTRCIQAGCKPGGLVLDPFCGTGTTGLAALASADGSPASNSAPRSPPWRPNASPTPPSPAATPSDRPPTVIVYVYVSRASARKERTVQPVDEDADDHPPSPATERSQPRHHARSDPRR